MDLSFDPSQLNISLAYLSGVLAAGSPCVVVLIPLILYRFRGTFDQNLVYFIVGFLASYTFFGFTANSFLTSSFQDGFKLGIGGIFVVLGVLSVNGKVNAVPVKIKDNSFMTGVGYSLLISANPCTLPFLAVVVSLQTTSALLSLFLFGLGLLTPSLLFVLLGKASIQIFTKHGHHFHLLNKLMNWILSISGFYLISTVPLLSVYDFLFAVLIFSLVLTYLFYIYDASSKSLIIFLAALFSFSVISFILTQSNHTESAHEETSKQTSKDNAKNALTSKCIDPSLLFCQACQVYIIGYSALLVLVSFIIFLTENEWEKISLIRWAKLKIGKFLNLKKPQDPSKKGDLFQSHRKSGLSEEEETVFMTKLDSVRHRVLNMV